jgi:hypothetical protein
MSSLQHRHFLDRSRIKPYSVRHPKPSDLRHRVTVCIAAIFFNPENHTQGIFTVSDQKITTSGLLSSTDGTLIKQEALSPGWMAMFAGDMQNVTPVMQQIRSTLGWDGSLANYEKLPKKPLKDVVNACAQAFRQELNEQAANHSLATFGMDFKAFRAEGRKIFTDEEHAVIVEEMKTYTAFNDFCELLVCGFDDRQIPCIFTVKNPRGSSRKMIEYHERVGYCAVGSGSILALGSLAFHNYNRQMSPSLAAYHTLVAKFMAERDGDVGHSTWAFYVTNERPDLIGFGKLLTTDQIQQARSFWETEGQPKVPAQAVNALARAMGDLE